MGTFSSLVQCSAQKKKTTRQRHIIPVVFSFFLQQADSLSRRNAACMPAIISQVSNAVCKFVCNNGLLLALVIIIIIYIFWNDAAAAVMA